MISTEQARKLRAQMELHAITLSDDVALTVTEMFPRWEVAHLYSIGDRIRYQEILYRCLQAHTSQDDWTPNVTPALWTIVSIEEWPEWVQPVGAHDAYNTGDKVSYDNKHWISMIDANVYSPGVYGWEVA